jgi:hypothetical protein
LLFPELLDMAAVFPDQEAHVVVAGLRACEWTVRQGNAGKIVDKDVRGDLDASQWILKEPAQRELAADWTTLGVRCRQHDGVITGSLEVADGEHALAFLQCRRVELGCRRALGLAADDHRLSASLSQVCCRYFANHPDSWLNQIILDKRV